MKFELQDSEHAARNALIYVLTDDARYAERAKEFLVAWASGSLKRIQDYSHFEETNRRARVDAALRLSLGFRNFSNAYDLIYNNSHVLSLQDHVLIQSWLRRGYHLIKQGTLYWPQHVNRCHSVSNHVTAHLAGLSAIGFVLDDYELALEAIEGRNIPRNWKTAMEQAIYVSGERSSGCDSGRRPVTNVGEVFDRYRHYDVPGADPWSDANRGYGYSVLSAANLAATAEAAYHHGIDLYHYVAPRGEQLLLPGIYYSCFRQKFAGGRHLIQATGCRGEGGYVNEVMKDGYINFFDILAYRLHHDSRVTRAFDNLPDAARRFQPPEFFGKMFDRKEIAWNFHLDGIMEGWFVRPNGHVINARVRDGALSCDVVGGDPMLEAHRLSLNTDLYSVLKVRMKLDDGVNDGHAVPIQVFWIESGGGAYSNEKKAWTKGSVDGIYRIYQIDLKSCPEWKGTIEKLRFDPVTHAGVSVSIDSITLQY
ncbi:MAG: alginate lyase family protein [Candidatus Omnitrophica bacterium]|nr:alginate lyase family protein [Candidatus Omnitrophota bacterium]